MLREQLRQAFSQPLSTNDALDALPEAAVLMPITDEAEPHFILTQRAVHLHKHAGEVAFPGGKREISDDSLWTTALRESREEMQLNPAAVEYIGQLPRVRSRFGLAVTPYVGFVPAQVNLQANPEELQAIFRVPLKFFSEQPPAGVTQIGVEPLRYSVPYYQFGEYKIWGLTAYMIQCLLDKLY